MEPLKKICQECNNQFWIIEQEKKFLDQMDLPLPTNCPGCRQAERLKQRGERHLYRTNCQKCSKKIIVSYDPKKETRPIYCKECFLDYFEKHSPLEDN